MSEQAIILMFRGSSSLVPLLKKASLASPWQFKITRLGSTREDLFGSGLLVGGLTGGFCSLPSENKRWRRSRSRSPAQ